MDAGRDDSGDTDAEEIPEPKPFEKYCIAGVEGDMVMICMFMSSMYVDGKWQCCEPFVHPTSDYYGNFFENWQESCNSCGYERKPWEEICISTDPSENWCHFWPAFCDGHCTGMYSRHPDTEEFEDWKRDCLSKCRWQYEIFEYP